MQLHEKIFKDLLKIQPKDKDLQVKQLLETYLKDLEFLKKNNLKEYEQYMQFDEISRQFYKSLFENENNVDDQIQLFNPLLHFMNFQIYRQITKTILRALYHCYKKYLQLIDSKSFYLQISEYMLENIDQIDLKEFSIFSKHLKCHLAKNKKKVLNKVQEILKDCQTTKDKQQYLAALEIINRCNLHHHFNLEQIQKEAIQIGIAQEYFNVIKKDKDKCIKFMKLLDPYLHSAIQKKIIIQHKLNYKNFHDLVRYQTYKNLNYMYKSGGLEKVEDRFCINDQSMIMLLKYLLKKQKFNEAYSVYCRHKNLLNEIQQKQFDFNTDQKNYTYIPNLLIEKNFFGPASICLGIESEKEYMTLESLGYQRNNIHYIDNNNIKDYENCLQDIDVVGLDCEFYQEDFSNFAHHKLATFQMATYKDVYIFDCIKLQNSKVFKDLFVYLFQSISILKIGHTFNGDIKVFEDTFKTKIKYKRNLKNVEKMYSKQAMSLAKFVHMFFDKELCKFEQTSNWQNNPLRETQLHYAALDAAVLIDLYKKLNEEIEAIGNNVINLPNEQFKKKIPIEHQKDQLRQNYLTMLQEKGITAKFFADDMLEKVARQLRNLGFDTSFKKNIKKTELFQICQQENRILLTTNKEYLQTNKLIIAHKVKGKKIKNQIKNIIKTFPYNLKQENLHSRCIECNHDKFICKTKEEVKEDFTQVQYVQPEEIDEFWICESCNHIFWKGSQYKKSQKQFAEYIC